MGIVNDEVLSWSNLLNWQVLLVLACGLVVTIAVALRPRAFWPLLVALAILGNLPKIKGYNIADEILFYSALLGGLAAITVSKRQGQVREKIDLHSIAFVAWMGYLIIQAVRGGLATDDSRVIRWVFLYGALLLGTFVMPMPHFRFNDIRKMYTAILIATLVGFVVYFAQGFYFEGQFEFHGRYLSQDQYVAGSATAVFPILVALPAAILVFRENAPMLRMLAWSTLIMTVIVAWYFDSRVTWLVMAAFLVVGFLRIGVRRVVVLLSLALVAGFLILPQASENLVPYVNNLYVTSTALVGGNDKGDLDRTLQIEAAIEASRQDWGTALFGHGLSTAKFVITPYLKETYARHNLDESSRMLRLTGGVSYVEATILRTTGFGVFLIDTGVVGLLLLGLNVLLVANKLLQSGSPKRFVILAIVPLVSLWLFVNDIQDIVLLYLLIMPYGVIEQLNRTKEAWVPAEKSGMKAVRMSPVLR